MNSQNYPTIIYTEEVMRDGLQIEDARIPVAQKAALLDMLSATGLKRIMVGSFVSPKYTPQMACMDELMQSFSPRSGVTYLALTLNAKGEERARAYSPPLTIERDNGWLRGRPRLACHMCDIFTRRNTNRSQMEEMATWQGIIREAVKRGAKSAGIGVNAAFGSNFEGDFAVGAVISMLERQHALWDAVGIPVTEVSIGDPMGWCHPLKTKQILQEIKSRWPVISDFAVHLHNSRGMALASTYAAIESLGPGHTLRLEGTLGGIGGCPYCGNGAATGMTATEDLMHMLEGMGIETGVDLDRVIECVWLLEKMIGRRAWGHVSRAGPRPVTPAEHYDPNAPFVETIEHATHFKNGPVVYAGCITPWRGEIESPYLDRTRKGLPAYEAQGGWPWNQPFIPKPVDADGVATIEKH